MINTFKEGQLVWTYIYNIFGKSGNPPGYSILSHSLREPTQRSETETDIIIDTAKSTRIIQCKYIGRPTGTAIHRLASPFNEDGCIKYGRDVEIMRKVEHIFSSKNDVLSYLSDIFISTIKRLEDSEPYIPEVKVNGQQEKGQSDGEQGELNFGQGNGLITSEQAEGLFRLIQTAANEGHAIGVATSRGGIRERQPSDGIRVSRVQRQGGVELREIRIGESRGEDQD